MLAITGDKEAAADLLHDTFLRMKQPDHNYLDSRFDVAMKDAYLGVRAPAGGKTRLLITAAVVGGEPFG